MGISLHLLGTPRIERDGHPLNLDTRKAIALIAYLVAQRGYQSRDTLSVLLWPENDNVGARGALRRTLSVLKSALDGDGLLIEREAIAFDPTRIDCDLIRFNKALAACEAHGHSLHEVCPSCVTPLNDAVVNYRGDFLQGFTLRDSAEFDLWQFQQTEHLRRLYAGTLEKLVHLYSDSQQYPRAIELTQMWLSLDPLHEAAHRKLIQLYAWTGQRSLALRQYHECVRVLQQELGVAPLDETSSLYQQVMENKIEARSTGSDLLMVAIPTSVEQQNVVLPLIGRETEMSLLEQSYSRASRQVVTIEGEAGIGKTRLAEDFTARRHVATATFRCFESETTIAYAPVIRLLRDLLNKGVLNSLESHWMAELARLLPELQTPHSTIIFSELNVAAAQARLYESICQAVSHYMGENQPGILLFEDVQWSDNATIEFVAYALRRIDSRQKMFMFTWRTEEIPRGHRLQILLAEHFRNGGQICHITLPRFTRQEIHQLVDTAQLSVNDHLLERIYVESEGLPFFVHEYLKLLQAQASLQPETEWAIPLGIHALLRSRTDQVSETARQILDTAAVIGRTFELDLVHECSGRTDQEAVEGIDELQRRGIVYDNIGTGVLYEFRHEKLRAVAYTDLSMARKRLLHRRAAQAILNRVGQTDKLPASAALIAFHLHASGQEARSADYYAMAGQYARSLFANREALTYFEYARALGYARLDELYQHIGDLHTINGNYPAAINNYEAGIAHARNDLLASLEHALGNVYHRLGEWDLTETYFRSALNNLDDLALSERARLLIDWSLANHSRGMTAEARQLVGEALLLAEESGSAVSQAQAHNMLGILARKSGEFELAAVHLRQSHQIAETISDVSVHIASLNNLALMYVDLERPQDAQRLLEQALEECMRLGDRHHEAALHNNIADLFHKQGMHEQAMEHLKRAVILFSQIGVDGQEMKPEIWKLTEW